MHSPLAKVQVIRNSGGGSGGAVRVKFAHRQSERHSESHVVALVRASATLPLVPASNHTWIEVYRHRVILKEGIHYGCWFFPLHAPYARGTGVFLNTGKTLVVRSRRDALKLFKLPGGASYATFRGTRLKEVDDSLWAEQAHAWGYDTVQILKGYDGMPELLVSRLPCLNQTTKIRLCPPVELELRTGEDASLTCRCKEEGERTLLNCDGTVGIRV